MIRLSQVLVDHPGLSEVKLALFDAAGNAEVLTFGDRFRVRKETALIAELKIMFGPNCLSSI